MYPISDAETRQLRPDQIILGVVRPDDVLDQFIPAELKDLAQWVLWRYEERAGKRTKIPYRPGKPDLKAETNNPSTWGRFLEALWTYRESAGHFDGIGFVVTGDDPYVGIDLDRCIDDSGKVAEWAMEIVARFASYCEITPSCRALRVWVKGKLPGKGNRKGDVEVYESLRYFTVTGDRLDTSPETIEDRSEQLAAWHAETFAPKAKAKPKAPRPAPAPIDLDDEELLRKALNADDGGKFRALFDGGTDGYPSASEADLALCCKLAFWTGRDAHRIERLFNRSGLGQRDKWAERPDYRRRTIEEAIARTADVYQPRGARPKPAPSKQADPPDDPTPFDDEERDEAPDKQFRLTDLGNGERLVYRHGRDLRHCHPWKKWLRWDGRRWAIDTTAGISRLAKDAVRRIYREAALTDDKAERLAIAKWAMSSEDNKRVRAMIERAAAEEGIPVLPGVLDTASYLLNCTNGTLDLRNGQLRDHRREDFITHLCPVLYNPASACPVWEATLRRIFADSQEIIRFWQRLCGYALTGATTEQILPIAHGMGANGKSTILNALMETFGNDYAMKAMPELLMVRRNDPHPTERADLFGKRLVIAIETGEGGRLNETLVKELTGSDKIRARRMREDPWEFHPTHKLVICTNHRPTVKGTDHAIWRRLKLIPFNVTIPDEQQDKDLPEKLRREREGILSWCVRGCLDWQRDGLRAPKDVSEATAKYRDDEDVIGAFLSEHCMVHPNLSAKASSLYERYRLWAEKSGEFAVTQRKFGNAMTERGYERHTNNGTWYRGVGIRSE